MCDLQTTGRRGWRGWRSFPITQLARATGEWHDLTHCFHDDLPVPHVFEHPRVRRVMTMPEGKLNVTRFEVTVHTGTHLDAPSHLFVDGPAFDEVPLHMLQGAGVVWKLDVGEHDEITPEMLQGMTPKMRPGDIVLLCAGWDKRFGTDTYLLNPALTVAAAEWLVNQGIKALGVDFATPDMALAKRSADFDWPVHKVLLSAGALVAENLTNLAPLANQRVEVVFGALNIKGADGSPARIIARAVEH